MIVNTMALICRPLAIINIMTANEPLLERKEANKMDRNLPIKSKIK